MKMNISLNGVNFIKEQEGCILHPYKDSGGVWTIGVGHTRDITENSPIITEEHALAYLEFDLIPVEEAINQYVKVDLTQNQFDALCSFAFNLGCSALRTSTLLRLLNGGDVQGAANEFLKWNHDNGKVVSGLTNRRKRERDLFLA